MKVVNDACLNVKDTEGIPYSFSGKGILYDNVCIEFFHLILKKEDINQN